MDNKTNWYLHAENTMRKLLPGLRQIVVWANNDARNVHDIGVSANEWAGKVQLALDGITNQRRREALPPVVIELRGGRVVDVSGLPGGISFEVVDHDDYKKT